MNDLKFKISLTSSLIVLGFSLFGHFYNKLIFTKIALVFVAIFLITDLYNLLSKKK
ncbi:Uncharacterised protein [Chlamydia trachomatis]|nr:Uncharacterised protein [Chlamydia trachomatis]